MFGIIDRFEGNYAVIELPDKKILNIEKSKIPLEAKEGDILKRVNDTLIIDDEETNKRRKEIETLTKDLWNQ